MPLLSHKLTLNINDNSNKLSVPVQLDITIVSSPIYCLDNHRPPLSPEGSTEVKVQEVALNNVTGKPRRH